MSSSSTPATASEKLSSVAILPNVKCNGIDSDQIALQSALTANGIKHLDLLIDCPLVLSSDLEFVRNISLHFQNV